MLWFPEAFRVDGFAVMLFMLIEESVEFVESVLTPTKSSGIGSLLKTISALSVKVKVDVTVLEPSNSKKGEPK